MVALFEPPLSFGGFPLVKGEKIDELTRVRREWRPFVIAEILRPRSESRSASSKTTVGSADRVSPRSRLGKLERKQGNLAGAVFKLLKELETPVLLEKKPRGIYTGTRKNSRKNEFFFLHF